MLKYKTSMLTLSLNRSDKIFMEKSLTKSFQRFSKKLFSKLEPVIKDALLFLVAVYRSIGTSFLGGQCRFEPSCSQYAIDALSIYPSHNAVTLIAKRICRCHPFGGHGYDPVPPLERKP